MLQVGNSKCSSSARFSKVMQHGNLAYKSIEIYGITRSKKKENENCSYREDLQDLKVFSTEKESLWKLTGIEKCIIINTRKLSPDNWFEKEGLFLPISSNDSIIARYSPLGSGIVIALEDIFVCSNGGPSIDKKWVNAVLCFITAMRIVIWLTRKMEVHGNLSLSLYNLVAYFKQQLKFKISSCLRRTFRKSGGM